MKIKRFLCALLTLVTLFVACPQTVCFTKASANGVVELSSPRILGFAGKFIKFDQPRQPPIIENGRVLAPAREIFISIWLLFDWDEDTQTITATTPGGYDFIEI